MNRRQWLAGAAVGVAALATNTSAAEQSGVLRNASPRIKNGAALDLDDLDNPAMLELFRQNCTSITPRNALKWVGTEQHQGVLNFAGPDRIVDFARSIDCVVYGHCLIWYRTPGWVQSLTDPARLRTAMAERIGTTMRHYAGRIYAWDVVNEPLEYDTAQMRANSIFQRVLGTDHIRESFELAHAADPNAILTLNEAHLEVQGQNYSDRRTMFLDLINDLRARNTPIHAVGLQAHFRPGLDRLDEHGLGNFCTELKRMGIDIYITELDASCLFTKRAANPSDPNLYGQVFADVVRVVGSSGNLKSVTTWGMAQKLFPTAKPLPAACPSEIVLYDTNLQPLPTLSALTSALHKLR